MIDTKAAAAQFRTVLKDSGMKVRVRVLKNAEQGQFIEVSPVADAMIHFTSAEIEGFCYAARRANLTFARGREIIPEDVSGATNRRYWNFYA